MRNKQDPLSRLAVIIVVLHFIISLTHGFAHSGLHIELNLWQKAFVLLVITVLPLVSGCLLWRRRPGGFVLLAGSMLGSLVFGCYFHFIAAGTDNVASLGSHSWAAPFQFTAVLLAITEAAGVLIGIVGVIRKRKAL
jgi:hypothetical protein